MRSYWEFGTSEGYQGKAKTDFDRRTDQVSPTDQQAATLVLVSPWTIPKFQLCVCRCLKRLSCVMP